ncbi:MAG: glycosyl hydrolase [Verrucomicrobia bacterium]|nr:glycosyl hydrolase [Verrucomicrobiota bacterium]
MDEFDPVTASRVRLWIDKVSSATPSIYEFETHLDDGPNLAHSDSLIVQEGRGGSAAIYLNSPNPANLRQALDRALKVYDVEITSNQALRYLHRVKDKTDVYFFANIGDKAADASVRLRGKMRPEAWDPHTGKFSVPEYSHSVEEGQPMTRVKLALEPVHSIFIVGR